MFNQLPCWGEPRDEVASRRLPRRGGRREATRSNSRLLRRERFIQQGGRVRVEVVLHQHDLPGLRINLVTQPFDDLRPVLRGALSGDTHAAPLLQRRIHHERAAHAHSPPAR